MNKKEIAKRYLVSAFLMFFIGTGFLFVFIIGLGRLKASVNLTILQSLLLSVLCSLVPLGSFTGFVIAGTRIKEMKTSRAALLIVLYPLVLAAVTLFGIIMIVPKIIISFRDLIRG